LRYLTLYLFSIVFLFHSNSVFSEPANSEAEKPEPVTLNWVGCGISKKSYMNQLAQAYTKLSGVKINIQGGGSTRGIRNVADQTADFGGSCRYYLPGNKLEKGIGFEPVAWDALAIIVHPNNPVDNLTTLQIKKIYSGKLTNWKQVGGPNKPIKLFTRKSKISGVGYSIRLLIFSDIEKEFASTKTFKSSGPLEKAIQSDEDAIAITGVSSARLRKVKILSLNDKQPDYKSIKSGNYVLYRPLYITYNVKSSRIQEIKDFIRFTHSRKGRNIMKKNNVVPYLDALPLVMIQSRQSLDSQRESKHNLTY